MNIWEIITAVSTAIQAFEELAQLSAAYRRQRYGEEGPSFYGTQPPDNAATAEKSFADLD